MDEAELLGTWSVDARYGPSAMEDCLIYFAPGQIGCVVWANLVGVEGGLFAWRLSEGQLTTVTMAQYSGDLNGVVPSDEGMDLDLTNAVVTVSVEDTPKGEFMRVLTLPEGTLGWIGDDKLGFLSDEPNELLELLLAAADKTPSAG